MCFESVQRIATIVNVLLRDANNALVSIRVSLSCSSQVRRVLQSESLFEPVPKPALFPQPRSTVKTFRQGAIAASIWKRQATSGFEYFDFTVSRSWKTSATGKEDYSTSFFIRNVDELHTVIHEAVDWIESQQASLQESNDFKNQTILQKAA